MRRAAHFGCTSSRPAPPHWTPFLGCVQTLTRMSDSEAMYSHAPQQQGAGFPNMAWGHEMQNSNPALHASSSSFGSMGKDAASRHNDSDDGSWDGNNNDRNGPSDAQLSYLKEKERYAQGPRGYTEGRKYRPQAGCLYLRNQAGRAVRLI